MIQWIDQRLPENQYQMLCAPSCAPSLRHRLG